MGFVNLKRMANIAKHYRSRFTTIVGIQPTGWTHASGEFCSLRSYMQHREEHCSPNTFLNTRLHRQQYISPGVSVSLTTAQIVCAIARASVT